MDADILNTIEEIRGYTFVAMIAIVVWVTIKSIQLIYPFLYRFSDNIHNFVLDLNYKSLKKGKIKGVIKSCEAMLSSLPNDPYFTWQLALAYYYNHDYKLAHEYFDRSIFLQPEWKKDAELYIESINNANKSSNLTGADNAPAS